MRHLLRVVFFILLSTISCLQLASTHVYELKKMRNEIASELAQFDDKVDQLKGKQLLIDNKCGMINTEGICYFNAVIQSLFANRNFVLFYIMNDFKPTQELSLNTQILAMKMLKARNVNPIPFLETYSEHQRLLNHCTLHGGNPLVLLEELLIGLYSEIEDDENLNFMEGAPQNYFVTERYSTTCKKCRRRTVDEISNVTMNIPFSNTLEESLSFYNNVKEVSNVNKYYKCSKCNVFNPIIPDDIKVDIIYPNHLIIVFERVQIKNNVIYSIFQEIEMNETITIDGKKYELYSAVCSYMLKRGYHANAIVKKNGSWVLFNDNQLEIFSQDNDNKTVFNNYAWILFFKCIE
ncbi:hypothetical protein EDEG_00742 [Edhazardia aedis USNM 41457]|uniref:ubiquitinyl hydrolase 1 n=1 Tax=Edhazardia aedis (strain USNM 41457) TaxID=1003232 RepID=J9DBR1_EDHAE|nr:hypothetical protein EDEG_00742 [Edhazardia aedis USNM 41457]|eukprot:EJW05161.1 hypothetical protein EDEG_00742 [Edhazardia aedis USNM 41457]